MNAKMNARMLTVHTVAGKTVFEGKPAEELYYSLVRASGGVSDRVSVETNFENHNFMMAHVVSFVYENIVYEAAKGKSK